MDLIDQYQPDLLYFDDGDAADGARAEDRRGLLQRQHGVARAENWTPC